MKQHLNWKANPGSVFLVAIPLFVIGMASLLMLAVLKFFEGDPVYALIYGIGILVLCGSIWNGLRVRAAAIKLTNSYEQASLVVRINK